MAAGFVLRADRRRPSPSHLPLSSWFLVVISFGALFVVVGKRLAEFHELGSAPACTAPGARASYTRGLPRLGRSRSRAPVVRHRLLPLGVRPSTERASACTTTTVLDPLSRRPGGRSRSSSSAAARRGPRRRGPEDLVLRDRVVQVLGRDLGGPRRDRDLLVRPLRLTAGGAPRRARPRRHPRERGRRRAILARRRPGDRARPRSLLRRRRPGRRRHGHRQRAASAGHRRSIGATGQVEVGAGALRSTTLLRAVRARGLVRARSPRGPARSPSAARSPPTCTARTTTVDGAFCEHVTIAAARRPDRRE